MCCYGVPWPLSACQRCLRPFGPGGWKRAFRRTKLHKGPTTESRRSFLWSTVLFWVTSASSCSKFSSAEHQVAGCSLRNSAHCATFSANCNDFSEAGRTEPLRSNFSLL